VVKVGSGVLSGGADAVSQAVIRRLAREVKAAGAEVVVVSSGAILSGWRALGLKARPRDTQLKQASAAVGQSRLMRSWEAAFSRLGLTCAQVLLTREDLQDRGRYLNARNTLLTLLRLGAVPVINENDTVAVEEIKFGDNDALSALVAGLCGADLLVLLTDQEGVYTADPRRDPSAKLLARVAGPIDLGRAGPSGSGGMESKVRAAQQAAASGIPAVIASGLKPGALAAILRGEAEGTLFDAAANPLESKRGWLAFAAKPAGRIVVDDGARKALAGGRSLLPSGVRGVEGRFEAGDVVALVSGDEFARGLTNYSSSELERVKGLKTSEIEAALGHKPADEVIHRDNLALWKN